MRTHVHSKICMHKLMALQTYTNILDRVSFGGGGGGRKGATAHPWIFVPPPPLGFKMLNDLPVYGQLVTLTIRKFLAAPP